MNNSFEVRVRKKIPYINDFIFILLIICFIAFWIVDLFFLPVNNTSGEIQTAWYILVFPDFLKNILFYIAIAFIILLPLHLYLRQYKNAVLTFLPGAVSIIGHKLNYHLATDQIKKVFCMDEMDRYGIPKGKMIFYFYIKRRRRIKEFVIRARLKNYEEMDQFMEQLIKYETLEIRMFDVNINFDAGKEI